MNLIRIAGLMVAFFLCGMVLALLVAYPSKREAPPSLPTVIDTNLIQKEPPTWA